MQNQLRSLLFSLTLFYSLTSFAKLAPRMHSIMLQTNGTLYQTNNASGQEQYNHKVSVEVLYLVRSGPTFGGRYLVETRNETTSDVGEGYGPVIGYYGDTGFFATFNYDILAKLGRWRNGEGFEFSVGYLEHIGDQLHIGARYSTRKIRYKTDITSNLAVNKDVSDNYPSLSLMYLF